MRLKAHESIWTLSGGQWWAGEFCAYYGGGLVKTCSGKLGTVIVPRTAIKPRTQKAVSA